MAQANSETEEEVLKKQIYVSRLEAHCDDCKEASKYAIQRFDILIITLSSGALMFSISFLKDVGKLPPHHNFWDLKIAWALFGSAIISNLFSQVTSYYANKLEMKITKSIIRKETGKAAVPNEAALEQKKDQLNATTIILNGLSFFFFIVGVALLIVFMFTHF
ncbi:hypothetical protein EXU57_24270 [Segetibacter sp. 3557_3]|uniref:hypothetical protein n=1 Tax=Segetibacter sp. 3557_3 TaxID=2547429 RepID=UPI00105869D3|nr:hypothetical protein [Segetibacter sp. 3557_3]TDH18169.1 hypothetical protein EXU57_24270 [Segetibacter sp. 3557_3]